MKIRLVTNVGKEFVIDNLKPTDTIATLKQKLTPFIAKNKQLFFYYLKRLDDDKTLEDYHIEDAAAIMYNFDHFEKFREDRVKANGWTEDFILRSVLGLNTEGLFEASCIEAKKLDSDDFDIMREEDFTMPLATQPIPRHAELYLGNISSHINFTLLVAMNITHIVTVHESLKPLYPKHLKYLVVEANDGEKQGIIDYFMDVIEFIEDARRNGGSVLVHCTAGKSRSAAMVCAYVMYKKRVPFDVALKYVKRRRPIVDPNPGFQKQLHLFHKMNFDVNNKIPEYEALTRGFTHKGKLIRNYHLASRGPAPALPVKLPYVDKWTQKDVLQLAQRALHDKRFVSLPSVDWSGKDLRGINLRNANLRFANLSGCNLQFADLENANLRHAKLQNADLSHAKLISTDISDAECAGAIFIEVIGLGERFKQRWGLDETSSIASDTLRRGSSNRGNMREMTQKGSIRYLRMNRIIANGVEPEIDNKRSSQVIHPTDIPKTEEEVVTRSRNSSVVETPDPKEASDDSEDVTKDRSGSVVECEDVPVNEGRQAIDKLISSV